MAYKYARPVNWFVVDNLPIYVYSIVKIILECNLWGYYNLINPAHYTLVVNFYLIFHQSLFSYKKKKPLNYL